MKYSESVKDTLFTCLCGWTGSELDLDLITHITSGLVCCPVCKNDDVRVQNDNNRLAS